MRIIAIILLGATAFMTLVGSVGTVCVAFNADLYGRAFQQYVPYLTFYQILIYAGLLLGAASIVATYALSMRDKWAYKGAVIILVLILVQCGIKLFSTWSISEAPFAPVLVRFMLVIITLVYFLVIRTPGIWAKIGGFSGNSGGSRSKTTGVAAITGGAALLLTPLMAYPSHMVEGASLVTYQPILIPLLVAGGILVMMGISLLVMSAFNISHKQVTAWFRRRVTALLRPITMRG
ncbi:MAG: hypothetical protein PHE15_04810 [Dehalococcoidales bacterium]|nr:hypothetical protein [Dehalococcoidales bacterium]